MALDPETDELWRIALFTVFDPDAMQAIVAGARMRNLRAGDVVFRRGEEADCGFVLTRGAIALEARDIGFPQEKILRPVAILGEIAMIASTKRPATAIAREPSSLMMISRALFCHTLEKHPTTAARVRKLFKDRLAQFTPALNFDAG